MKIKYILVWLVGVWSFALVLRLVYGFFSLTDYLMVSFVPLVVVELFLLVFCMAFYREEVV